MKKQDVSVQSLVEFPGDELVFLAGEGRALKGFVRVRNAGAEPLNLREAVLRLPPAGSDKLTTFGQASISLTLQPGQTGRIRLGFDYDPLTPPGEYTGELEINGQVRKATAFLAEVVKLALIPHTVVLDQPTGSATRRVVVTNEGNVPLKLTQLWRVPLGKELPLRRGVSAVVAAGEKPPGALEKLFADLTREESKAVFADAGILEIQVKGGVQTLQPGESRVVELDIRLPEKLEAGARYIGRAPLYTSDIEFVIVPMAGSSESPKPPRPTSTKVKR